MKVPEKIGRYEIVEELGRGGMAVVFLARDPFMDRLVALKLMPRQLTVNEDLRTRFQREAKIIASLEHPAIVPVHDFGEFNEQPYLVMRYMTGGSLKDYMDGKPIPLPDVVRILHPLAQALDKAHDRRIIHRDLKPDNILFDADNNPYLSDFGIARLAEGTQTTSIMGTPAYMSPEQIKGDVELDGRSDIYALGVILFEMLSGQQPYTAETPTQIMMKHMLDPVPNILEFAHDLPPMTQVIVEQAMAKDRNDRFSTAEAMVDVIEDLLTASQRKAVGAAMAGTVIQETILEIPEDFPLADKTIVEPPLTGREGKIETLYGQIRAAHQERDWVGVLAAGAQIKELHPDYRDVNLLMDQAKANLTGPIAAKQFTSQAIPGDVSPPKSDVLLAGKPAEVEEPAKKSSKRLLLIAAGVLFACIIFACGIFYVISTTRDTADTGTESNGAASSGGSTGSGAQTSAIAGQAASSSGNIYLNENFEGEDSAAKWDKPADEIGEFYVDGGRLFANAFDSSKFISDSQPDHYENFEMHVQAEIIEGGEDVRFGAAFFENNDVGEKNFTACLVSGAGSAICTETVNGIGINRKADNLDISFDTANDVLLVVNDGHWAMAVNGQCVSSGPNKLGSQVKAGLLITTNDDSIPSQIAYDDLLIRKPTSAGLAIIDCKP